jgi:hypothetical protein
MGPVNRVGATPEAVAVTGNENEIYGHFTCDDEAEQFEWTCAQPPFSFLSLTAVDEILQLAPGPARGPFLARHRDDTFQLFLGNRIAQAIRVVLLAPPESSSCHLVF